MKDKKEKTRQLSVRMTEDLHRDLNRLAHKELRPMAQVVCELIQKYVEKHRGRF